MYQAASREREQQRYPNDKNEPPATTGRHIEVVRRRTCGICGSDPLETNSRVKAPEVVDIARHHDGSLSTRDQDNGCIDDIRCAGTSTKNA